jgi:hypothetical protein
MCHCPHFIWLYAHKSAVSIFGLQRDHVLQNGYFTVEIQNKSKYVVQIKLVLTVGHLILQNKVPMLVYVTNDRGCRILCLVFCKCRLFRLNFVYGFGQF